MVYALACNPKKTQINLQAHLADNHLTPEQQDSFTYAIIRHLGKLHKKANHTTKFDAFFDEYYQELTQKHTLLYYIPQHTDGYTYFCFIRQAPSLYQKKVAIAGKLLWNQDGTLKHYEELYRTWKMPEEELLDKNETLFSMLIEGKDLSPYYNHRSGDEEWIEFPDSMVRFDTQLKRWITQNPLY